MGILVLVLGAAVAIAIVWSLPGERVPESVTRLRMICPHCQERGSVTTKRVSLKKRVSGGKAVALLLTCGLSLFFVGLSRQQDATQATCSNCDSVWHF